MHLKLKMNQVHCTVIDYVFHDAGLHYSTDPYNPRLHTEQQYKRQRWTNLELTNDIPYLALSSAI